MATFAASQNISTITPPHSSDGRTSWDYAVPVDSENSTVKTSKPTDSDAPPKTTPSHPRHPLAQQRNGTSRRTNTMDPSRTIKSSHSAEPGPAQVLTSKTSNVSVTGDHGYADPHRPHGDSRGYASESKRKLQSIEPEIDDSNWIHRDKLAQIESRELVEAGFRVPRSTVSRATSSRSSSQQRRDRNADPHQVDGTNGEEAGSAFATPHDKRQRTMSPGRVEEEDLEDGMINFELRTPEEVAAERELMAKQSSRPGTSRIPVKKSSPLPVPAQFIERDSPLTRSRTGSVGWSGSPEESGTPLGRVKTGGSQAITDDEPHTPPASNSPLHSPTQRSPSKGRVASKGNTAGGNRKASGPAKNSSGTGASNGTNPRSGSTSSPTKLPGTSSRPGTSHAKPEGEPPWLVSMYKPDPRLPPDQQILPTHAKRMAQEQWEKEGKTGTVYDRDFRLLNDTQVTLPQRRSSLSHRLASKENLLEDTSRNGELPSPTWPLAPSLSKQGSAATSGGRPGTSGTDHGGYSIMPNIPGPKHPPNSPNPALMAPKPLDIIRLQEPMESDQAPQGEPKKGGCACCVVM